MPRVARYTWRLHWPAALLVGSSFGVVGMSAFVFKRSLGAPASWVPALIAIWQATWILTPLAGRWLSRAHPQRVWRLIGVASGLPLVLVAFVGVEPVAGGAAGEGTGDMWLFVGLLAVHYLLGVLYVPHRGGLMRTNYPLAVRGRMYGLREMLAITGMIAMARIAQHLLDQDPRWLRVLFPVSGVLFAAGLFLKARIRWRNQRMRRTDSHARDGVRDAFANRRFLVYEAGFMAYGFGFLMAFPLLVLFMEGELKLDYNSYTKATMVAMPIAQLAGMYLWGRFADRVGVVRMTATAFAGLLVFLLVVPSVTGLKSLVAAYVLFGAAMSGVMVGWSLGPLHFAPEGHGHAYAAVHFMMVGIRSVIAPFLGYAVKEWTGSFAAGFYAAAAAMAVGVVTMTWLARSESREPRTAQ
jgi:MFS family permease